MLQLAVIEILTFSKLIKWSSMIYFCFFMESMKSPIFCADSSFDFLSKWL